MQEHIEKIIKIIDANDKIRDKLNLYSLYYEVLSIVDIDSSDFVFDENIEFLEKIFEFISQKAMEREVETISSLVFMNTYLKYVEKAPMVLFNDGKDEISNFKKVMGEFSEGNDAVKIIDKYDNFELRDKAYLMMMYRINTDYLLKNIGLWFGDNKADYLCFEYMDYSLEKLDKYLEDSVNDNKPNKDIIDKLGSNIALFSKDFFIDKIKEQEDLLENTPINNKLSILREKDRTTALVSDIYDLTGYIDDENSDEDYIKDCCYLLDVTEDTLKKDYFIKGSVSPLQLKKVFNNRRDE